MIVKIVLSDWEIKETNDIDVLAETHFPDRVILYNPENIMQTQDKFKHCMLHEITHAIQAETGQWQNASNNGKRQDEFDSEYIAELFALYGTHILDVYKQIERNVYQNANR